MTDEDLMQKMRREWQEVRKSFHYPQLPQPQLVDNIPNGMFDMDNLEVKVSEPFIKGFEEHGISNEEALNECLTHELTHFMKYPGSVLNVLRLQKSAQGITEGHKISELRTAFTEAQTNIYMLNERKHPVTARMRKAHGLPEEDSFGRLMYGLYQEVSGQDLGVEPKEKGLIDKVKGVFGIKPTDEERALIDKLKDIDYLDKSKEATNFRRFVQVLKDYQPKQNQQGKKEQEGKGNGQGEGQGNSCSSNGNGLEGFTNNQIREGLKQFAQECSNPGEYEEIVKQILSEGEKGKQLPSQSSQALERRAGSGRGITQLADNFYTALAEKYTIPIRRKPMRKNGSLYPHSHTSFQVGDSITEVDPFSTPGILPGITKKWVRKEGEVFSSEEAVPDSFIVIDNSPSMFMPNGNEVVLPSTRIYQHIVGATAISNAYLVNGAKVAVYSFGSNDHLTQPTKDRELVHRELRRYSRDGGTTFNPKFLESVLKGSEEEFDISVISDMDIKNLDSFVNAVLKIPKTHRIHLLYTANNDYTTHLRKSFSKMENVAILPLIRELDIERITMGELQKSVR
jgi:hypothetical protein